MQVASLEDFEALKAEVAAIKLELREVKALQPAWVNQEEASRLTGCSRTWFFRQRKAGKLPIKYKKTGPRTIQYDRADCVKLGRQNLILPPAEVEYAPQPAAA